MTDPYDLQRFVAAQASAPSFLGELRAGRKTTHWMWFVFPQLRGLGRSAMARRYAIASLDEARAYLTHPVLGPRLDECVDAILPFADRGAEAIFGSIDAVKLRSSLTLFHRAARDDGAAARFREALDAFFGGEEDPATLAVLGA
jgi:uncharacterized protein (DUF1810 family)